MAKKPMKKRPPPPQPSFPSSSDKETPPSIPPVKKFSAGSTVAPLRKHPEPSLKPADGEKEEKNEESSGSEDGEEGEESSEDSGNAAPKRNRQAERRVSRNSDDANDLKLERPATKTLAKTVSMAEKPKENDESSESEEKESTDDESSEDSMNATRQSNPLTQERDSQIANDGKQDVSNTSSSSDSGSGDGQEESKELNSRVESKQPLPSSRSQPARDPANPIDVPSLKPPNFSKSVNAEEEGEGFESEEEESGEDDESSEYFLNTAPISTQPQDSENIDDDKQASNASSSSGSGLGNDEEDIETPTSDPSLKPLCNMPIDSSAQLADKEPNSMKQSTSSPARISKKKRTAVIVGAVGGQDKERFRRIWSNEDELALLQGILEYKERHHVIPNAHVHAEPLLKSVKDSLSICVSVNQINDKVRRMKKRFNNTAARKNLAKKSKFSDPHNAAVFDLSKKIWDSVKEESIFLEDKITPEKNEENFKKRKTESKHFAAEYPSLYWLLRSEHANNALVLQNHIPIANAKMLDEKCKKLEMIDIQLNMQKIEFLSSAVKLIKDVLAKC